jgi:hypothetical protein
MSYKNFTEKLTKIIGQVSFRPTLTTFSSVAVFGKKYENDFDDWSASKSSDVSLLSAGKKKYLRLLSDSINYGNESKLDYEELNKYLSDACQVYIKDGDITQFRKVGVKTTNILESKFKFNELVDLLYNKFYSAELPFIKGETKLQDVAHILDLNQDGIQCRIQIGPVNKAESIKFLDTTFDVDESKISENNIFVDIDTFTPTVESSDNIKEVLIKITEINASLLKQYLEYLDK